MRITRLMTLCVALLMSGVLRAELTIEITKGVDNPVPVAIVPFSWTASSNLPADVAEIVASVVLAGEISLASAISSSDWVSSHEQYGRNR